MGQVLRKLLEVFYTKKLDIVVIGLENRYAGILATWWRRHADAAFSPCYSHSFFYLSVERLHYYQYWLMVNL